MGNSLRVVVDNYIGSVPFPCHLQLGPSTSIDLLKEREGELIPCGQDTWRVTYTVDEKSCQVELLTNNDFPFFESESVTYVLSHSLSGNTEAIINMKITDSNYMRIHLPRWSSVTDSILWRKPNTSFGARRGVMDKKVDSYGSQGRWGRFIAGSKENKTKEDAEVVTAAHYIVKSSGTSFYRSTETNTGVSVVAKFRASHGKVQITGEGLEQHPVSSLLYMFDEVNRTGVWKPTMCPQCEHKRKGKRFWQSDSEDSDSVSMRLPRTNPRNARGISNGGRFQGNGIVNFNEYNIMDFRRRRQ